MIDLEPIKLEMRGRIIDGGVVPYTDYQFDNRNFNPDNKTLWIRETVIPGEELIKTNARSEDVSIFQYDVFAKKDIGTKAQGEAIKAIKDLFDINDTTKSTITIDTEPTWTVFVTKISGDTSPDENWSIKSVLIYVTSVA